MVDLTHGTPSVDMKATAIWLGVKIYVQLCSTCLLSHTIQWSPAVCCERASGSLTMILNSQSVSRCCIRDVWPVLPPCSNTLYHIRVRRPTARPLLGSHVALFGRSRRSADQRGANKTIGTSLIVTMDMLHRGNTSAFVCQTLQTSVHHWQW